jgi:hypothetical protein
MEATMSLMTFVNKKIAKKLQDAPVSTMEYKLGTLVQHKLTKLVGRVTANTVIGGERKLVVELPSGKTLVNLAEREFCLASQGEYSLFANRESRHTDVPTVSVNPACEQAKLAQTNYYA